jgi:uncharacterized protein YlxW (UPF0749 family)
MEAQWWWMLAAALVGGGAGFAAAWQLGAVRLAKAVHAIEGKTKARAEHLSMRATRRLREENTQLNARIEELSQQLADGTSKLKDEHQREMQALAKQLIDAHDQVARVSATPSQIRAFAATTTEAPERDASGFAPTTIDDRG